ncbi:hypothetical protein A9762_24725 [Pandoraea sp. ISTKB]|nr:hypothetical protein A9762_24725 [Pandoraea sp. ISTKB]
MRMGSRAIDMCVVVVVVVVVVVTMIAALRVIVGIAMGMRCRAGLGLVTVRVPVIAARRLIGYVRLAGHLALYRRRARQTDRIRGVGHVNSWLHDSCYPSFKTL